ncbi:MAG: AFG1/ZapE family ATPase, partial [Sphingomicrobium sp.]
MTGPVGTAYAAMVAGGELKPDPDQKSAVAALDRFAADMADAGSGRAFLTRMLGRPERPCGVYLWGGVGRGKSMLMDLAFDSIAVIPKRRTH